MEKIFLNIKYFILNTFLFLFPFFFLPFTQEYFTTGKFYFLAFTALILILISGLEILTTKKLVWQKGFFDNLLFLFLTTLGLSVLISSPNKVQALLNTSFGPVMMLSLIIIYFYLSRNNRIDKKQFNKISSAAIFILSIITIFFFFNPLKNTDLPLDFQFLKNESFTPMGGLLDLAIFLGFFVVTDAVSIVKHEVGKKKNIVDISLWTINLLALSLTIYKLAQPSILILPPFKISWYSAVEILKNPLTALFGVGIDNFASIFTRVKDAAYNQSSLWQINSFTASRSTILHIFTESGLLSLLAFALILFTLFKQCFSKHQNSHPQFKLTVIYWLIIAFLFPTSLVVWFLFFVVLYFSNQTANNQSPTTSIDLSNFMPMYLGIVIVLLITVGVLGYLLERSYESEFYFKKSIDGYTKNNLKEIYDNQRQAIILNPYIEKYRINFAQTNLLIANNIANNAQRKKADAQLSEEDRTTITQAIQAAISEAKAAVTLNPQKATNWENLAIIYRNIINVAQGADVWTVSAYQRAIVIDPQNPTYRLNLGGVYYAANNWEQAAKLFEEAVILKTDWSNAYYNLAWAYYKKGEYQLAASTMENVLKLINPNTDKADYDKAKSELDEFKKKIPEKEEIATSEAQTPTQLNLPTPATNNVKPKIELPEEASPEAK